MSCYFMMIYLNLIAITRLISIYLKFIYIFTYKYDRFTSLSHKTFTKIFINKLIKVFNELK